MNIPKPVKKVVEQGALRALLLRERFESGTQWNPLDKRYLSNPYPLYRHLREHDPIHRSRLMDGHVFSRHEDISALLRDARLSADDRNRSNYHQQRAEGIREGAINPDKPDIPSMLRLDPPDHARLRGLVNRAFTPRAVEALRPRIEALVEELLDRIDGDTADIMRDIAVPLPLTVIAEMLGVPIEDRERFKEWSDAIATTVAESTWDELRAARKAGEELSAYIADIADERRAHPREDLISALVAAESEGDRLSMTEVYRTVELLLVAGNETTTNLIGNGTRMFARHPSQWELLRADPSLAANAVEELLRFDSPVQMTSRVVTQPFEYAGMQLKKGQELIFLLGAANRDPAAFDRPNRLDITRENARSHLSFSQGIHYCLGAPLARLEGEVTFRAMARRFERVEVEPGGEVWGTNTILHGMKRLPVRLRRAGAAL
ncbi:MAG: cytochrome P450 [Dehalococcoidia bacterium]